jgi:hypothetical protein
LTLQPCDCGFVEVLGLWALVVTVVVLLTVWAVGVLWGRL